MRYTLSPWGGRGCWAVAISWRNAVSASPGITQVGRGCAASLCSEEAWGRTWGSARLGLGRGRRIPPQAHGHRLHPRGVVEQGTLPEGGLGLGCSSLHSSLLGM